jgi:rhamnogalacturonyl hydrolase YesR
MFQLKNKFIYFRLRMELNRMNEQLKEYRDLINEKTFPKCSVDNSQPIEKNFCLYDHTENKLYSKPLEDDQLSESLQVTNEIE